MINAAERTLVKDAAACAMVLTGSDKIRSGYGNGDCLLLDFRNSVFALSDGAERYARASRLLLERLSTAIETQGHRRARTNGGNWPTGYSDQSYQHKATFSCAALLGTTTARRLVVTHGGDSMVFVVNSFRSDRIPHRRGHELCRKEQDGGERNRNRPGEGRVQDSPLFGRSH